MKVPIEIKKYLHRSWHPLLGTGKRMPRLKIGPNEFVTAHFRSKIGTKKIATSYFTSIIGAHEFVWTYLYH